MNWRGTLLIFALALASLGILLVTQKSRTRSAAEPLLELNTPDVRRIVIGESGSQTVLEKKDGIWRIAAPIMDRADNTLIREILGEASGMTVLGILDPKDLKGAVSLDSLDLSAPKHSLTFQDGKTASLEFGSEGPAKGEIYARLDGAKEVYLIPSRIAELTFQSPSAFRDQRLASTDTDHLQEIVFSKGNGLQQTVLRRKGERWMIESPFCSVGDHEAINGWLNGFLSAKIVRWMPEACDPEACGLNEASAALSLWGSDHSQPVTITFGSEVPGSSGARYARCSDRPGICVVKGLDEFLAITPNRLRSKSLKPIQPDSVDRIEIVRPQNLVGAASSLMITRKKGSEDWLVSRDESVTVPATSMKDWFSSLSGIKASAFEPATPDHLATRGMDEAFTIRLTAHLSENSAEEAAGDMILGEYAFGPSRNGLVAIREGKDSDLMIVSETALELTKGPKTDH